MLKPQKVSNCFLFYKIISSLLIFSISANISKGAGISAWGLVFLILSLILLGVFAYYFIIFYPILCKKERKYDRIELATV